MRTQLSSIKLGIKEIFEKCKTRPHCKFLFWKIQLLSYKKYDAMLTCNDFYCYFKGINKYLKNFALDTFY